MTDRLDSLKALREKVRAGGASYQDFLDNCQVLKWYHGRLWEAHSDEDMSGAIFTLEDVLPGWIWGRYANGGMWVAKRPRTIRAEPKMHPANGLAWCVISALIVIEEGKA